MRSSVISTSAPASTTSLSICKHEKATRTCACRLSPSHGLSGVYQRTHAWVRLPSQAYVPRPFETNDALSGQKLVPRYRACPEGHAVVPVYNDCLPVGSMMLEGESFPCPHDTEAFLRTMYGYLGQGARFDPVTGKCAQLQYSLEHVHAGSYPCVCYWYTTSNPNIITEHGTPHAQVPAAAGRTGTACGGMTPRRNTRANVAALTTVHFCEISTLESRQAVSSRRSWDGTDSCSSTIRRAVVMAVESRSRSGCHRRQAYLLP